MALMFNPTGLKTYNQILSELLDIDSLKDRLPKNEAWQIIGATGKPAFKNGWQNAPDDAWEQNALIPNGETVAYREDSTGMVWLRGHIYGGSGVMFTIPSAKAPKRSIIRPAACNNTMMPLPVSIVVMHTGDVILYNTGGYDTPIDLGSVSWWKKDI